MSLLIGRKRFKPFDRSFCCGAGSDSFQPLGKRRFINLRLQLLHAVRSTLQPPRRSRGEVRCEAALHCQTDEHSQIHADGKTWVRKWTGWNRFE